MKMNRIYRGKTLIFCCLIGVLVMLGSNVEASSDSDRDRAYSDPCDFGRNSGRCCDRDSSTDSGRCCGRYRDTDYEDYDDDDNGKKVEAEIGYEFEAGLIQCVGYEFEAGLIQCSGVFPTGCGTDSLIGGKVKIEKDGTVEVHVGGASPVDTYDVVYVSLGGSTIPIGPITTDSRGNASMRWWRVFALGDTGAGNLMLQRGGVTQFVSGFAVVR